MSTRAQLARGHTTTGLSLRLTAAYCAAMTGARAPWRDIDGRATVWFDTPSLMAGVALAAGIVELDPGALVDVRATGVRVRLGSSDHLETIYVLADDFGLVAGLDGLQRVRLIVESPIPDVIRSFWSGVLGDDPLERDLVADLRGSDDARPLRDRFHVDVVVPGDVATRISPGEPGGPYGVRHADADGNEIDLVPGDPFAEPAEDWQGVFAAMACYRVDSSDLQAELVAAAAEIADDAGFDLLIDLRPGLVVLDSGKDRAEPDVHGLDLEFADLAARLQRAARDLGATPDPTLPRCVQVVLDAADLTGVRGFWAAVLDYRPDPRPGVTDLVDPRRLGPVLVLQDLDTGETDRVAQCNRMRLELLLPVEAATARVEAAVHAGGRVLEEAEGHWLVADPEGNEVEVLAI
ncbi:hypothetical protein GCM10027425_09420 [Alteromonas gracilis]